jgi:hypothetical protein
VDDSGCPAEFGVYDDLPLRRAIEMLVEDTVHSSIENAPLLNATLRMSIKRSVKENGLDGHHMYLRLQ